MSRTPARYSAVAVVLLGLTSAPHAAPGDVFDRFAPELTLRRGDGERLERGEPVVRVVAGRDGVLSLAALMAIDVTAERLLAWSAAVEALQKGRYVPQIGRFSSPPRLEDLASLVIDAGDLRDLAGCRPGDCGLKLSAAEMEVLANVRDKSLLDVVLKRQFLRRATDYLVHGEAGMLPYHDHERPLVPAELFGALLQHLPFMARDLPCYAGYLAAYPVVPAGTPVRESFLYWSKETLGMKPIISITHFTAARFDGPGRPEAVVVARQVYATHYRNASITVTMLVAENNRRYLVYLSRSSVDAFVGFFGGMVRRTVERRVKSEAPAVLRGLRLRLESGEPPPHTR